MKRLALILVLPVLFLTPFEKAWATQAQLACSPTTSTISVGATIIADIVLNTRGFSTSGTDAILTYTNTILSTSMTDVTPVTSNTNWTNPINKLVDATLGKIELDYGASQSAYTGSGSIGKIKFTALAAGNANINFSYQQEYDNTTPGVSKVWGQRNPPAVSNILTDVVNCVYTVTAATPNPTAPPVTPSVLPRTGSVETTIVVVGSGLTLAIIGLFMKRFVMSK